MAQAAPSGETSAKSRASVSGKPPGPVGARGRWSLKSARAPGSVSVEPPVPIGARSRWSFTINNYTAAEEEAVKSLAGASKYLICGREVGRNGTRHLQGFINLKRKQRFNALRRALGGRAHLEPARGDDCSNRDYCSKGGDILIEAGEPQRERARTDLTGAIGKLRETKSLTEVARGYPEVFVRNHRGLRELLLYHPEMVAPRDWKTRVIVYVGSPGVGKSRLVHRLAPGAYWKPRGKWWDGYDRHDTVVMDDFYGWVPFDDMLRLCDRYPLRVETKGGTVNFVAKTLYVTSNRLPQDWYSDEIANKGALYRRINELHVWTDGRFECPPPRVMFPHRFNY